MKTAQYNDKIAHANGPGRLGNLLAPLRLQLVLKIEARRCQKKRMEEY